MRLLPQVKKIEYDTGTFKINSDLSIRIDFTDLQNNNAALYLSEKIRECISLHSHVNVSGHVTSGKHVVLSAEKNDSDSGAYSITCSPDSIRVNGASPRGTYYGVQTLLQIIMKYKTEIPCFTIIDSPDIAHRGFYHDITRGKVPKLDTLKLLVEKCASYKINELQLYVEHAFAFKNIPELWIDNDPITPEEIIILDKHCRNHYVDLIPSLATFGHLYELLRIKRFEHLNELEINASSKPHDLWDRMAHYTIDPLNEESLALITSMIEEYLPLFSSKYFNICCDETFDLGKGRNAGVAENAGSGRLYVDFLKKIITIVKKHGKTPMFWGDIVLHHPELIQEIPHDAVFLNWAYGADVTEEATATFANAGVTQYVCPGVSGWSRFANEINAATKNIRSMVQYGKKYGCHGVLNTDWGDCGHVNLLSSSFHGMILGASLSWNTDSYHDDSEFDSAVSILEWHDPSCTVMSCMRELGTLCFYHFGNFYAWVNDLTCLWNKEDILKNTEITLLAENYEKVIAIENRVSEIYTKCDLDSINSLNVDEMRWSIDGIKWSLAMLLYKKVHEYGQSGTAPQNRQQLCAHGTNLCLELKRIWRMRNKESELKNIVKTFRGILEMLVKIG